MARAIRAAGGRTGIADGSALATCRMYASGRELREGYRKSLWAAFGSPAGAFAVATALAVVYVLPAAAALTGSRIGRARLRRRRRSAALSATRWGGRPVDAAAHPISVLALLALLVSSWVGRVAGLAALEGTRGMSRAVVIGAGLGGLAAAARLAAAGHRVTVYESAATVGGKLGVLERDGFTFDTGPSLLTMPAVLEQLFADTGGPTDVRVDRRRPGLRLQLRRRHRAGASARSRRRCPPRSTTALGPGAGEAWRRLHDRSRRLWELVGEPVLRRPVSVAAMARMSARPADLRAVAPWQTIDGLGRRMLPDPRLRIWLNRYATYSGSDPRRTPAVLSVTSFVEQEFGAWYVPGGLRRIVDAVEARCAELGVEVHTGSPVESVLVSGGRAVGVRVDGRDVVADCVVSNVDAAVLYERLLPNGAASAMRRRLRRAPAVDGRVRAVARARGPAARSGPSGVLPARLRRSSSTRSSAVRPGRWTTRQSTCTHPTIRRYAPTTTPKAGSYSSTHPLTIRWAASIGTQRDWGKRYTRRVLDLLAERGADVRDRIRFVETLTPADLQRRTGAPGGAIYGTASHGPRAALRRPANRSPLPGLYLVGGSAHPGGGIPLVLMSAEIVAGLIGPAESAAGSSAARRPATGASRRPRPPST